LGDNLKRFFLLLGFVFSFFLFFGCCVKTVKIDSARTDYQFDVVEHVENSTVRITYTAFLGDAKCSGVWINDYDIMTARHCVEYINGLIKPGDYIYFSTYEDWKNDKSDETDRRLATISYISSKTDLAIISSLENVSHSIAKLGSATPISLQVHIVGHTAGYPWTYQTGIISGSAVMRGWRVMHVTSLVWFGNSGGGAFNSEGSLLGISSMVRDDVPGMSFFIPASSIKEFLKSNNVKYYSE
jgi:S1-C subfamily serine protease